MNYYDENEKNNTLKLRELIATLPPFCKDFFRSIEPRTTSRTRIAYAYDLKVFFGFLIKNNPALKDKITLKDLEILTFQDIEEYMEYLKYYNNKTNDLSGIKRKIASLKSFYKYYYRNDLISSDPSAKVLLPKLREKEIIRLESDEVANLIDITENGIPNPTKKCHIYHEKTKLRDQAIISLLLDTGIRVSECVGINLSDIDEKNTSIRIKRKGAKEAIIYYGDEIKDILSKYIKERKNVLNISDNDSDALFLSLKNRRISVRSVEKLVKKYASIVAPLKHITPHKLRSTFGTNLYRETGDIYLVASVLGHNDVNTTKKHYAAMDDEKKRIARNIVKLRKE